MVFFFLSHIFFFLFSESYKHTFNTAPHHHLLQFLNRAVCPSYMHKQTNLMHSPNFYTHTLLTYTYTHKAYMFEFFFSFPSSPPPLSLSFIHSFTCKYKTPIIFFVCESEYLFFFFHTAVILSFDLQSIFILILIILRYTEMLQKCKDFF